MFNVIDTGFNSIVIRATKDLIELAKRFSLNFSDLENKINLSEESLIKFYKEEEQSFFSYDFRNHNLIKVDAISNYFILFADLKNKEINNKIISKLKKYNSQKEYFFNFLIIVSILFMWPWSNLFWSTIFLTIVAIIGGCVIPEEGILLPHSHVL